MRAEKLRTKSQSLDILLMITKTNKCSLQTLTNQNKNLNKLMRVNRIVVMCSLHVHFCMLSIAENTGHTKQMPPPFIRKAE